MVRREEGPLVARDRLHFEREARAAGYRLIAGVDEVGNAAWAGPMVAAAVILPEDFDTTGLRDSEHRTRAGARIGRFTAVRFLVSRSHLDAFRCLSSIDLLYLSFEPFAVRCRKRICPHVSECRPGQSYPDRVTSLSSSRLYPVHAGDETSLTAALSACRASFAAPTKGCLYSSRSSQRLLTVRARRPGGRTTFCSPSGNIECR
jgi:hypothetical protein